MIHTFANEQPVGQVAKPLVGGFVILIAMTTWKSRVTAVFWNELFEIPKTFRNPTRDYLAPFMPDCAFFHGCHEPRECGFVPNKIAAELQKERAFLGIELPPQDWLKIVHRKTMTLDVKKCSRRRNVVRQL